jgi:hypothetical protein
MPGRCFALKVRREIAHDCEEDDHDTRDVRCDRLRLRQAQRSALQKATIAEDRVGGSDGKPKDDESIEVERLHESSVQQGGERACRPAAGTFQVQVFKDGALGIEAVLRRWEQQQNGGGERYDS